MTPERGFDHLQNLLALSVASAGGASGGPPRRRRCPQSGRRAWDRMPPEPQAMRSLSIVVPALNEEENIGQTILSLRDHGLDADPEIIVVDGNSSDGTVGVAKGMGAKVVSSERGRGMQLNTGVTAATGEWMLFCHADTLLPSSYGGLMQSAIASAGRHCRWGSFMGIRTNVKGPVMRMMEWCVRLRTRLLWMPYGDQAIFVESAQLRHMGGFKNQPLLEDVDLVLRLKKVGQPAIVPRCVQTSGRRWVKVGVWRTFLINQIILTGWALGFDPSTLAAIYYGRAWQARSGKRQPSE